MSHQQPHYRTSSSGRRFIAGRGAAKAASSGLTGKQILIQNLESLLRKRMREGWSRDSGAGFVAEDIQSVGAGGNGLWYTFSWGSQSIPSKDLNLREIEETIRFLKSRV